MVRPVVMFMACCAAVAMVAAPANATFPGANGKLAVMMSGPGSGGIGTVNPDGSGLTTLTTGRDFQPAWSADGRYIAFGRYTLERGSELWVMDADGANSRPIRALDPLETAYSRPTWSPDGNHIALARWDYADVEIIDIRDGSSRSIRPPGSPDTMEDADWSPDGREIVVVGRFQELRCDPPDDPSECQIVTPNAGLYRVAVDGSAITRIPIARPAGEENMLPSWSPSGAEIAFARDSNAFISIVGSDGGTPRDVAQDGSAPTWSPDGTKLAYDNYPRGEIYTINADGTGGTKILGRDQSTGTGFFSPSWQPISNRAPVCSGVAAGPGVLRPANGKFRKIELSGASDPDGDDVSVSIAGVTQDEPVGRARDAWRARSPAKVWLRAERRPQRDGRVYRIAFRAADDRGAECEGVVHVAVPRHRHRPAVDSAPPSYDSLSPSGS